MKGSDLYCPKVSALSQTPPSPSNIAIGKDISIITVKAETKENAPASHGCQLKTDSFKNIECLTEN